MEIYGKNIFYFHISLFMVFKHDLSGALISPVSQLQTQQVMTSQIRLHTEYLIQTYNILLLILWSYEKFSLNDGFNTI